MSKHLYRVSRECKETSIGGKEYTFGRFTRRVWEALSDFGMGRLPNPVDRAMSIMDRATLKDAEIIRQLEADDAKAAAQAKAEGKPPPAPLASRYVPMGATIWEKALVLSNRYLEAGSPEMQGLIRSIEGESYLFWLLLQKNHPDISEDTSHEVYMDLRLNDGEDGRKTVREILDICSGRAPEPAKNEDSPAA